MCRIKGDDGAPGLSGDAGGAELAALKGQKVSKMIQLCVGTHFLRFKGVGVSLAQCQDQLKSTFH